jgi:hypothetical protein
VSLIIEKYVGTKAAAEAVSVDPIQFSKWAKRRGLTPCRYAWVGRVRYAVWDLDEVYDAEERGPIARTKTN